MAYFRTATRLAAREKALRERGIGHALTTDIPEGDPLEAYRAASRAFPIGKRLWIEPGEAADGEPPDGRIALRVPASRAFGTGSHASTRLALLALEEEALEGLTVLDVGTGSGVLALAAAGLGARRAIGLDTDAEAVFVARENLARHPFGDRVRLYVGPAVGLRRQASTSSWPTCWPRRFCSEARGLLARAARTGKVLLSGVTREREGAVLARLRTDRWKLDGRRTEDEWVSLCLARAS